jgi:hypothetical protein
MPFSLVRLIRNTYDKIQGVSWTDGDTSRAIVTFLPKTITHRVQAEFTYGITFGAVVALLHAPLDAEQPVSSQ